MREIAIIDTSVRDGQQSLWATRMTNAMFLPFLGRMDRMGFAWIDLVGGAVFDVCVRYLREDPWERMRLAAREAKRTPLNVWTRGQSLFTFEFFPDDIIALTIERCAANGIRRYTCYDSLNDIRNIELSIATTKACGMHASAQIVYTLSPVHTDDFYRARVHEIMRLKPDSIGIKDPSGLLTLERARTLVPAVRAECPGVPLELHTHCRGGVAELVCLESVPLGVDIVHTGVRPLASGDALPDARYVIAGLKRRGYRVNVDDGDLAEIERHFMAVARTHAKPIGTPNRYDPFLYEHQVPGGMISNLKSQLADIGLSHRLGAVLEEAGRVRRDLGYPILVSPFAQFVITQSVINVVQGARYATMPDEIVRYVLGHYGTPAGPVDADVMDRAHTFARGLQPITERPGALVPPKVKRLRRELGASVSDDDLLLHAFYQPAQLAPLFSARAGAAQAPSATRAETASDLLAVLKALPRKGSISIRHPGLRVEWLRA